MYLSCKLMAVAICLLCTLAANSQRHKEDFSITPPEQKVANSLYNHCRFIDGRKDTADMGIVQLGAFNRKARVQPEKPIGLQIQTVFEQLIDSAAKEGEFVFLLRSLSFAEVTKAMSEKGYVYLRANAFAQTAEGYKPLGRVDTVVLVKSMDVTRAMFRRGSKAITEFIGQYLVQAPDSGLLYSLAEVMALDSMEKRRLPVYNTATYAEGVYKSFAAFLQQQPEITNAQITVNKEAIPATVKIMNEAGKQEKIKSKDLYALVYQGKPYIATDYGYYPLEKKEDDFYFTGKAKVNPNSGDIMMASLFFGIIGGLLASSGHDALFYMKVDHVGGGFVRIREIPVPAQ
jgi:hypothetical protein